MILENYFALFESILIPQTEEELGEIDLPEDLTKMPMESWQKYLQREDAILSLVRERRERVQKYNQSPSNYFNLFDRKVVELLRKAGCISIAFRKTIVEKLIFPVISKLTSSILHCDSEEQRNECVKKLRQHVHNQFPEFNLQLSAYEKRLLCAITKDKNTVGCIVFNKCEVKTLISLSKKINARRRGREYSIKKMKDFMIVQDYSFLSHAFFIYFLDQLFQAKCLLSDEERMNDATYRSIWEMLLTKIRDCQNENGVICVSKEAAHPRFLLFLEDNGYIYQIGSSGGSGKREWERADFAYFAPFEALENKICYEDNLYEDWSYQFNLEKVYTRMFLLLYDESGGIEETRRYAIEEHRAAKVFETKKNIPEKYVKAMQASAFNNTFGYVEIDEQCDLLAFHEIEKEFTALKEICLGDSGYQKVAIRFRKLGRHKAAGLYFSGYLCLAVDIRYPSSLGHEFFHMFDLENGELSTKYNFLQIKERYSQILKKEVDDLSPGDSVKVRMYGKTKYNLDYYLIPTEIFARCGEIYLTHLHGIDNSLVKPKYDIAYPVQDMDLLKMIEDYYSVFFPFSKEIPSSATLARVS